MPPRTSCAKKRKRAPEVYPSSATRQVNSTGRRNGVIVRSQTVEPAIPRLSSLPPFDDDLFTQELLSQSSNEEDTPEQGTSKKKKTANPSRSVSVSATHARHVDTRSPTSRPGSTSGFRTGASTSMNFSVWKLLLSNPALNVDVN